MLAGFGGVAHRDGGFYDHHDLWIDVQHILNDGLNRAGVKVVGLRVVVGRGGDDDVVRPGIGFVFVQRGLEVKGPVLQVVFDLGIFDGRLLAVKHLDFFWDDIKSHNLIVLGEQNGAGETDEAGAGDGYFHYTGPFST